MLRLLALFVFFSSAAFASENQFGVICIEENYLPAADCVEDIEIEFNTNGTPSIREYPSDHFLLESDVRCFLSGGGPGGCGTGSG